MNALRAAAAFLALLLLGAHLLRWAGPLLLLPVLAALVLPFLRSVRAVRLLQGLLGLACLEWLRTAWMLAGERAAAGQPFLRMLAILLAVAAFSGWAAWFAGGRVDRR